MTDMGHFRYFASHLNDPDVQNMFASLMRVHDRLEDDRKNIRETVDFRSLPLVEFSVWQVDIEFMCLQTPDGRLVHAESSAALRRQDLQQKFAMACTIRVGEGANFEAPRIVSEFAGLPNSSQVEE